MKKAEAKKTVTSAAKKSPAAKAPAKVAKKPDAEPEVEELAPAPKVKLPVKERNEIREMLMTMREGLSERIRSLKDESLTRRDDVNDMEDGTDAFDRQFSLNIASSENDSLFEIDHAIRRLDEGAYGVCEQCHALIEKMRLKALPFVRLCVACQSENEKGKPKFRPMNEDEGV